MNGKPYVIRAAELHYPRIPRAYWEKRIKLCKAMGMNTICIYLFWNLHEQQEGKFDFSGQNDVAEFVRLIQKNGMYCIVRPGPYVCAEWDMGGLPWWLLKKKDLEVRTLSDSHFMARAGRFLRKAGAVLAPLQIQNGGNIIMVQVENEYGVWGDDGHYMAAIRDTIRKAGFDKVQLFRCDWSSNFDRYEVAGVASTLNFGAGANVENQFEKFRKINPDAPLMCSEYWTGWFDQWGRPHETRGVNSFIWSLKDMMERKISFSLYMAHGGTSFGQWSGANAPWYAPTVSSYDYDAPINEAGKPTDKFFAIRDLLKDYLNEGEVLPEVPDEQISLITVPQIKFTKYAALFDNLPRPNKSKIAQPMEFFDQGWGRILYRTTIPGSASERRLLIEGVHDYALIYLDGKYLGKLDRRLNENTVKVPKAAKAARLDILVEATGRVNYGRAIIDRKGIAGKVVLKDGNKEMEVSNWNIYNFPVESEFQEGLKFTTAIGKGPGWYQGSFTIDKIGDTYLDLSSWGKGMVWVNGYNLGRYWKIGPTQTMFLPGVWLKKGLNQIIVLDIEHGNSERLQGVRQAIYEVVQDESMLHRKPGEELDLKLAKPVLTGSLPNEPGWKKVTLPATEKGRYFCLEVTQSQSENDPVTSLAEMEVLAADGKPLSSLNWSVVYADSEEVTSIGSSADKIFDLQESVIWQTQITGKKPPLPHAVVIDMGRIETVSGIRLLPRGDTNATGIIKDFRFYLQDKPFTIKKTSGQLK
nr:glycoside hydrolase family 35 protein [Pedobacter xinjiangensis]